MCSGYRIGPSQQKYLCTAVLAMVIGSRGCISAVSQTLAAGPVIHAKIEERTNLLQIKHPCCVYCFNVDKSWLIIRVRRVVRRFLRASVRLVASDMVCGMVLHATATDSVMYHWHWGSAQYVGAAA